MIENGMRVGADAEWDARMQENERWYEAEMRAAEVTSAKRQACAIKIVADPELAADLLYQAMAEVSIEGDALCESIARMLILHREGYDMSARLQAILVSLAKEAAVDEIREENPENYL